MRFIGKVLPGLIVLAVYIANVIPDWVVALVGVVGVIALIAWIVRQRDVIKVEATLGELYLADRQGLLLYRTGGPWRQTYWSGHSRNAGDRAVASPRTFALAVGAIDGLGFHEMTAGDLELLGDERIAIQSGNGGMTWEAVQGQVKY